VIIYDKQLFEEFKTLYYELLNFKDNEDFKKNGFGAGGSYNKWLKNVEKLKNNPESKSLLRKGVIIGDLEKLGFEYLKSKGKETETTKHINRSFVDAISPKPTKQYGYSFSDKKSQENIETSSGEIKYEKIKKDYQLFGKWEITNKYAKTLWTCEIYQKGNEYISVIPEHDYTTHILDKKGKKYFERDNFSGDYYLIDSKMDMTLYDNDGELQSSGYKAVKVK